MEKVLQHWCSMRNLARHMKPAIKRVRDVRAYMLSMPVVFGMQ